MQISCIIPTRNRSRMTLAAIESVRAQAPFAVEIIVVDDGSTDNTLAEVKAAFPGVRTLSLTGAGPGPARNAGVAASRGDIIMFLDSDDIWLRNHVGELVSVLDRGFKIAYGVARTSSEVGTADFLIPENGAGIEGDCFGALLRWCFLVPSAMALHRDAFQQVGGFDPLPCGEDWIFFLRLAALFPFGFAGPEPITRRTLHRGSLCFLSDKSKLLGIIKGVLDFLKNEPRASEEHFRHFTKLHNWTAASRNEWSSVQEWYVSLLEEKII